MSEEKTARPVFDLHSVEEEDHWISVSDLMAGLMMVFFICGNDWETDEEIEGIAQLKVCKNCLKKLNYQGYAAGGRKGLIFSAFSLEEFFSTYSSFFPHLPTQFAGPAAKDNYTTDWPLIAGNYKAFRDFVCEECELSLTERRNLLHVHHVNGLKKDNRSSNLKALCVVCHRAQPCHGHMFVSCKDRRMITCLRREQVGLGANSWHRVIDILDPGVEGLAIMCRHSHLPVPKVGYEIRSRDNSVISVLELAWSDHRVGIAIDAADAGVAESEGWTIWKVVEALDEFETFSQQVS